MISAAEKATDRRGPEASTGGGDVTHHYARFGKEKLLAEWVSNATARSGSATGRQGNVAVVVELA